MYGSDDEDEPTTAWGRQNTASNARATGAAATSLRAQLGNIADQWER